jgi:hypothetical protein
MAWRSKKILALIPPVESEDSEFDSDEDAEQDLCSREFFRNTYSGSPSPQSIPSGIADVLDDLSDIDDNVHSPSILDPGVVDATTLSNVTANQNTTASFSSEKSSAKTSLTMPAFSIYIPETPSTSSVMSPLEAKIKTRQTKRATLSNAPAADLSPMPQPSPLVLVAKKRKMKKMTFSFKKAKYTGTVELPTGAQFAEQFEIKYPQQYFRQFFDETLLHFIVDMTNLYSVQESGKSINVTKKELEIFIGIEILMGIVKMPAVEDYWCNDLRFESVASSMSLKRYRCIKRYLHFCDNTNVDASNRYHKIAVVMEHVRQQCLRIEEERSFAVDEMIIPYKGKKAGGRKQYNPKKPHKWGFKFLVRAGTSGMVYDFFAYDGSHTFQKDKFTDWEEEYLGVGGKTVVKLCRTISSPILSTVYFDNWFTSLELIFYLRNEMGILSLGTIRKDRLGTCQMINDKEMKKKGRGAFQVVSDNSKKIAVTKWMDNKCINIASSFCAQDPVSTIERYDRTLKQKVVVPCPNAIKVYNTHMGGVDIADMLTALYRIHMKTRRWYLSIFAQMLDISLNNSWLLHRRDCKQLVEKHLSLKRFRTQVALALIKTNTLSQNRSASDCPRPAKIAKPFLARPVDEARLDCYDHFPVFTTQGRCRLCKNGKTTVICTKCGQRLCHTPKKNCFILFHKEK